MNRLLLSVLLASATAFAQYTAGGLNSYGYSFNNPVSAGLTQTMWNRINQRAEFVSQLKKRGYTDAQLKDMSTPQLSAELGGGKRTAEEPKKVAPPSSTKFKPTGKRLLAPTLAASLTKVPEEQKVLLRLFEVGLTAYAAETKKDGLDTDVSGAIAFFLGAATTVAHDGVAPDDEGLRLVARQLQQIFDTPELKKVADADKQRFFELLVCMGTWLLGSWEVAVSTNDDAFKAQLKEAAAGVIKGFLKLEPSQVQITSAGLQLTK